MEPLHEKHVELDFAALMSSREHLRSSLNWGDWPRADFKLEENRKDLIRHWTEFERREAYAYTVLSPDRSRCLGCVYLNPAKENPRHAVLAFWVVEDQLAHDLDRHLLTTLVAWTQAHWPLDAIAVPNRTEYPRGAELLTASGFHRKKDSPSPMYVWKRRGDSSNSKPSHE